MFTEQFNTEVLRAVELGLVQKWFRDARYYGKRFHAQRSTLYYDYKQFSMSDLYPVFFVWAAGLCLSLLVFIVEKLAGSSLFIRLPYKGYLE